MSIRTAGTFLSNPERIPIPKTLNRIERALAPFADEQPGDAMDGSFARWAAQHPDIDRLLTKADKEHLAPLTDDLGEFMLQLRHVLWQRLYNTIRVLEGLPVPARMIPRSVAHLPIDEAWDMLGLDGSSAKGA